MHDKKPTDYEVVGVHVVVSGSFDSCGKYRGCAPSPLEAFVAEVPSGVEVVVGYRTSVSANQREGVGAPITVAYTASGTALVPKRGMLPECSR